ncbi:MAG TPA: peptidase MA family metallohydrolase [Thermomicrobiales bacterium]
MSGSPRPAASRHLAMTLLAALLLLASWLPVAGQAWAAAETITIEQSEATASFPEGITFRLVAESRRPIQRVELLYNVADDPTLNLLVPTFEPGRRIEVEELLNLQIYYLPAGIDISYRWRIEDDRGAVVETEPETLLWLDTRFDWQALTADDVTVYSYTGNEAFSRLILESAQTTVDRLKVEYGLSEVTPIRIWVYNSREDFNATKQANEKHWAVGTAYPNYHVILATIPEGSKREVGRVIPHEVSHQLLYQATKNPFNSPPLWLDEGLAVYAQDVGNEDDFAQVQDAASKGRLYSIRALISDFPTTGPYQLAYAESHSIVAFVIERFGIEKMRELIAAYREGVSHDEALRRSLGVDTDELDRLWKESLGYQGDHPDGVSGYVETAPSEPGVGLGLIVLAAATLAGGLSLLIIRARWLWRQQATRPV